MTAPVFLSNPPELKADATALAGALEGAGLTVRGRVKLIPGDLWDQLHHTQRGTRVTAALIPPDAAADWYQSDDIARAIALQVEGRHRIVPVYRGEPPAHPPAGLMRVEPATWPLGEPPTAAVAAIKAVAQRMAAAPEPTPAPAATTVFLLYARPDADWAVWMAEQLRAAGFDPRLADWNLTAGQNRWLFDQGQLRADRVLLLVSEHTPANNRLQAVWTAAFDGDPTGARAQLVPVLLDDTPVPLLLGPRVPIDLRPHLDEPEAAAKTLTTALAPRGPTGRPAPFPGRRK